MDLSLEEKCRLVTGFGAWHIGDIHVSDGPHGVRAQRDGAKNNDSIEATCFPTASAVACSWNTDLVAAMARGIAEEAKELGVSVILGPGINMKRSPLCGRNFEYYSEDPYLAGMLGSAYVKVMQKNGVGTSLKHFAANNQETHRMTMNSMIDNRTLHEIYLSAFERVVKEAKPATIMASYNYLNGHPACENSYLLTDVLRKKWGYEGLVMSDWGACVDLVECLKAGMDVEMPDSCGNHYKLLMEAVQEGKIDLDVIDQAVARIQKLNDDYRKDIIEKTKDLTLSEGLRLRNHMLAELVEEESAVLLKNDGFLPLTGGKEVVVIGGLAERLRYQGGGSSHIHTCFIDSVLEKLEKYGLKVSYAKGYCTDRFSRVPKLEKEAMERVNQAKEKNIPILFFGGLTDIAEGEGYDRTSFDLPDNQKQLLSSLLEINDNIGFVSFSGSPYDMELPMRCKAILQMYLGGEAVGSACAKIITGLVNPSGKLAETFPMKEEDIPCYGNFARSGEQEKHVDDVPYLENLFIGYRYYDTFDIPVNFCFGHGLSYSSFLYSDLRVEEKGKHSYKVSFTITNNSDIAGKETAQIYVQNKNKDYLREKRKLAAFAKVELQSKESKKIELIVGERSFSIYKEDDFQVVEGSYDIQVAASIKDIRLETQVMIREGQKEDAIPLMTSIPWSVEEFKKNYEYEMTDFSHLKPGEYTTKNSLTQMSKDSSKARRWIRIGNLAVRLMMFGKSKEDPEVRMMREGILEGNIDSVCNQSGGVLKYKTIQSIVESANKGGK